MTPIEQVKDWNLLVKDRCKIFQYSRQIKSIGEALFALVRSCGIVQRIEVSWNVGTPKSSISMGCSLINQPFWDARIYGNPQMLLSHFFQFTAHSPNWDLQTLARKVGGTTWQDAKSSVLSHWMVWKNHQRMDWGSLWCPQPTCLIVFFGPISQEGHHF